MFEVCITNRHVHKRTLEGDGEKPSRHEHEGPLLILFFFVIFIMDVKPKARIAEIVEFYSFENLENSPKVRNIFVLLIDNRRSGIGSSSPGL